MLKLHFRKICATIAVTALATSPLLATDFVVNTTADSGAGSLRQAITDANANGGGDIVFPSLTGTIHLTAPLPAITASVNILGPGTNLLTVSGNNQYSIFSVHAGTTNLFSDFTMADAYGLGHSISAGQGIGYVEINGCAISNAGAMTVRNCVITNCVNHSIGNNAHGAVDNEGTLDMQNCLFTKSGSWGYTSGVRGGCVYNGSSNYLTMKNCILVDCKAASGHGVANYGTAILNNCQLIHLTEDDKEGNGGAITGGNVTLISCLISNCDAGWEGGALLGGGFTAINTTIVYNGAAFEGGALYLGGSNYFYNCTISSNGTSDYGGGALKNFGVTEMVNCTLAGNFATLGGSVYNLGQFEMTNCTMSGNRASGSPIYGGGGILNSTVNNEYPGTYSNVTVQLTDCTIVSNAPGNGPGGGIQNFGAACFLQGSIIANNISNDFSGVLTSQGYNLIRNITNCTLAGDLTGNITNANPLLGPLQNNGGVTATHALLAGSPAIDAGLTNGGPAFDQRGVSRPQGAADDIGAFESGAVPAPVLLAVGPNGNGCINIDFSGVPGRTYTILRSSSPLGPWLPLVTSVPGSNACGNCLDVNPPHFAYYRVAGQ